jgi:ketosteroid isomerase-like protein
MEHAEVMRWVARYEEAWRSRDLDAVEALFTEHAQYRSSPYEPAVIGHHGIKEFWLSDGGVPFTMAGSVVAVDGPRAVVRVEVQYGEPTNQEYRDLWVLRFADGRVEDFEEWAYWPGKPYEANPT